eukprot:CAMPEP_0206591302 /NCGR_PEP_ID=MMETSP0325_2-20121206/40168_1 /ASSEMBLY_ACC=CAM_ASM_000347 /TAXON_ID=2866 /ORGANISM="Crypthecodinium cohnii, Strain Seligo" /LENGTH=126 /DNA_ID=CAMNT_0054100487 /DNA_START=303 /DNA_END=679 /DNA_ORIENTATION=-
MAFMLPHLHTAFSVEQAVVNAGDRLVCVRFGMDYDPNCMQMDEIIYSCFEEIKGFCDIYLVDIREVPEFNKIYDLQDPVTVMFFFRKKPILIDSDRGNNKKLNWVMSDKREFMDLLRVVCRGAEEG